MKPAGYILAFYLLLLAAIPCCLPGECGEDETTATTHAGEEKPDCGSCSPFFSCEGCIAVSIATEPAFFELAPVIQAVVHAEFLQTALPEAAFEFWQPPRGLLIPQAISISG